MNKVLLNILFVFSLLLLSCKKDTSDGCTNGVKDSSETDIDCGGNCKACAVVNTTLCENGIMDANETGIDCGGSCVSCNSNFCSIPLGVGDFDTQGSGYTSSTVPSTVTTLIGDSALSGSTLFKAKVTSTFLCSTGQATYTVLFFKKDFIQMPINLTRVFTCDSTVSPNNTLNKCTIGFNVLTSGNSTFSGKVPGNEKVYLTRINTTHYNLKFCSVSTGYKTPAHTYSSISLNTNFSF